MSRTTIYPYVYKGIHPSTGEFYIGLRYANKRPAEEDLGVYYKTSSKNVKPRFHEFERQVLAVFSAKMSAAAKRRVMSPETRARISTSMKQNEIVQL